MAKEDAPEEEVMDEFQATPEDLRENDEITDSEEAFMEGYESGLEEEEEEEKPEKTDEFDI
jgi:hypothetical protein